jgi:PDZ domain-containing protein
VAGTGTIDADGKVGPIGGIQQKIAAAASSGASVFLVPADNCDELAGLQTDIRLVRVASLREAIDALRDLRQGDTAALPRCR